MVTLPTERFGIRLKVLGKTRSGKSTALRRLLTHLLPLPWARIVVLDGKRDALAFVAAYPHVTYLNSFHIDRWAETLGELAAALPARYAALDAGRPVAPILLVADEIQVGTRHPDHKKTIREALVTLAEQSGALGDCLILASQRAPHAIPPGVTVNCNAALTLLGMGYFHFQADAERPVVGRVPAEAPDQADASSPALLTLTPPDVPRLLAAELPVPRHGRVTLYTGESGSGLTYHLEQHRPGHERVVYLDLQEHSHKTALEALLAQCQAVTPPRLTIGDLTAMSALALTSTPTLLLVDNAHLGTQRLHASLNSLLPYAAETALAFATPLSALRQPVLDSYLPRARRVELRRLRQAELAALADRHLDAGITGRDRETALRHVAREAQGHPKTAVRLAQNIEVGSLAELRELESGRDAYTFPLLWLVAVLALAILLAQRLQVDSYLATVIFFAAYLILRPLLAPLLRQVFGR